MFGLSSTLESLGFAPSGDEMSTTIRGYELKVYFVGDDPEKPRANYGPDIKVHHRSIENLARQENLVVLECVVRLLRYGYLPPLIELECDWRIGHGSGGRLDVLLRQPDREIYAMIECKAWGADYSAARNRMLEDGGQLLCRLSETRAEKEHVPNTVRGSGHLNMLRPPLPPLDGTPASSDKE